MNRATEMAPGFRARCVPNRHGLFPPRNWQPSTLANGIQLAEQKGVYADDLDTEVERLYRERVAPIRKESEGGHSRQPRHGSKLIVRTSGVRHNYGIVSRKPCASVNLVFPGFR